METQPLELSERSAPVQMQHAPSKRLDLDKVGMTASLLCAVHCVAMPMVVTLFPLLGLSFLANEATEWILIGLAVLLGMSSLCLSFRQHRRGRALAVLSIGFALLALGRLAEEQERELLGVTLVVLGGLTVAGAHLINRRLCQTCPVCHHESNT